MSITGLFARTCNQTAVYWGSPVNDGTGGKTFAEPVEIACRYEDMTQIVTDAKGVESTSRAVVYLLQDVDEEGYLYLGTLESLYDAYADESSAGDIVNPSGITGAYVIKRFQKTPVLGNASEFLRKAYLTPSLSFGGF
jgi:hypothetical protein